MPLRRWLIGACLGLLAMTGCKDEETTTPPPPPTPLGNGTIGSIKPAAHNAEAFTAPLDATPSPMGDMVFFTARNADGAGVFRAAASGEGAVMTLYAGDPISGPVGITVSTEGALVYVADPGALVNDQDEGTIWSLPASGGTPSAISGTAGYAPRGIVLVNEANADVLYFTGKVPSDGAPGVFKVHASGGAVTAIATGGPFSDPNGIAVTGEGVIYVADSAAEDLEAGSARIIEIRGNTPTILQEGLQVGFPAGIALSQDNSALLISALDPATSKDQVLRIDLATKQQTAVSDVIGGFEEAAGLHRAAKAEVYAWADSSADGSGTVYVLTPAP
jgi:DNA-binding beta-propeller fold protein YncE